MDSIFNTVTNASSLITKTVKDVTEVNIQDEATTVFSRAKQFTEENLAEPKGRNMSWIIKSWRRRQI